MTLSQRDYWERRARQFPRQGLGVVCYPSPWKTGYIDFLERQALFRCLHLSPGARILDLGCGVGRWVVRYARRGAQASGVDFSPEMLRLAERQCREQGVTADLRLGEVWRLEFPDSSFDVVTAIVTLLHVTDSAKLKETVKEMVRVLKPGGLALVMDAFCDPQPTPKTAENWFIHRNSADVIELFQKYGAALKERRGVSFKRPTRPGSAPSAVGCRQARPAPSADSGAPVAVAQTSGWLFQALFFLWLPLDLLLLLFPGLHPLAREKLLVFQKGG